MDGMETAILAKNDGYMEPEGRRSERLLKKVQNYLDSRGLRAKIQQQPLLENTKSFLGDCELKTALLSAVIDICHNPSGKKHGKKVCPRDLLEHVVGCEDCRFLLDDTSFVLSGLAELP